MSDQTALKTAEELKLQGNTSFKSQDFHTSARLYQQALDELDSTTSNEATQSFKSLLLTNLAAADYNRGYYQQTFENASKSLDITPNSLKALHRSLLAALALERGTEACDLLEKLTDLVDNKTTNENKVFAHVQQYKEYVEALARHNEAVDKFQSAGKTHDALDELSSIKEGLQTLLADIEGEAESDVLKALKQLELALQESIDARAYFTTHNGFSLLFFYMTEAYCVPALHVLKAAAGPQCILPASVWLKLVQISTSISTETTAQSVQEGALSVLHWAATKQPFIRQQLLLHPLATDLLIIPINAVIEVLKPSLSSSSSSSTLISPSVLVASMEILEVLARDEVSLTGLITLKCQPLMALIRVIETAEEVVETYIDKKKQNSGGFSLDEGGGVDINNSSSRSMNLPESEREALAELRIKQRAVYNQDAIRIKKAALRALEVLCSSNEVVLAETVLKKNVQSGDDNDDNKNNTRGGGSKPTEGPFVSALLSMVRRLHQDSPKRTAPVLGPDGQVRTYSKRPFAADYKDNPTGDFLARLDLAAVSIPTDNDDKDSSTTSEAKKSSNRVFNSDTMLEMGLRAVLAAVQHGGYVAMLMQRRDILGLCETLMSYLTATVVDLAETILATVCDRNASALEELLRTSGISSLIALAKHSTKNKTVSSALDQLVVNVDSCSGEEFARLTEQNGALLIAYRKLQSQPSTTTDIHSNTKKEVSVEEESRSIEVARRLIRSCTDRAQRVQASVVSRNHDDSVRRFVPSKGAWDQMDRSKLLYILYPPETNKRSAGNSTGDAQNKQQEQPMADDTFEGLGKLKKGFLSSTSTNTTSKHHTNNIPQHSNDVTADIPVESTEQKPLSTSKPAAIAHHHYANGVTIEEIDHQDNQPTQPQAVDQPNQQPDQTEEEDIPDLHDVFDSRLENDALRQTRQAWVATPLNKKVRWTQTSTDISAWIVLPQGTRAKELCIDITATRLVVRLGWFGRVVDGQLYKAVKAGESQWCLEDNEVHILLPKDGSQIWWKSLFEGGEEKGYYELLKEAVDADEPVTAYQDMGDDAKDLLDSIIERQAYINAGLIDPEGFDDFRVVIGENSLNAGGGK